MAAYAALVTLMNLMEDIQNHPHLSISLEKYQSESVREKVCFFLDFIESYNSYGGSKEAEDLESQIASAAHAAEDVIESHIVDQIHAGSTRKSLGCLLDLRKVIEDMDSIKEKVMEVMEKGGIKEVQPTCSTPATSSRPLTTGKTTMVGFDDELIQLMDVLTGQQSSRQIISIIGMGGIGKTTLARNVYENALIIQHFDTRVWATISQDYNVREILLELLSCKEKSTSGTDDELGERLFKSLFGRRYLIILDDMWSSEVWEKIKFFFPDNGKQSRIIITTRLSNMASHFSCSSFVLNFLDEDKSWKLFCEKAFREENCPLELVKIGKKIVEQCKGLPLSIVVIGGHLGKSSRKKEHWETVAKNIKSVLNSGEGEQCLSILSLSYSYLPAYLKPCFLYMGIFTEDHEIHVSELVKLWVAEGFLKPNKDQSLEEVAKDCLKDLFDRNLILVRKWSENGKIKTCNIHDLLRELCLKVAEKEKFLCVLKLLDHTARPINRERRVTIHGDFPENDHGILDALESAPLVRSLMCAPSQLSFGFKLLKTLTVCSYSRHWCDVNWLRAQFRQQVNLRYLRCNLGYQFHINQLPYLYFPSSISLLWNLQTIIIHVDKVLFAKIEIWKMLQLRHVEVIGGIYLPHPPLSYRLGQQDVLCNLQTLLEVENFMLTEKFCKRIPNIKKLGIFYDHMPSSSFCDQHNLSHFHKLESLVCSLPQQPNCRNFVLNLRFPSSLQRLTLKTYLHWEDLTIIGSLPHLEVLYLDCTFIGPEWNPVEGEFCCLKFLSIHGCLNLETWNADSSHFPVLETLVLRFAFKLAEIPSGIGEIPTIQRIELYRCSVPAAISAMRILVEQEQELGDQGFLLQVELWFKERVRFMEMVEEEDLRSNNLRLDHRRS